jgi:O-antigen/teichoic acid export membrane protein
MNNFNSTLRNMFFGGAGFVIPMVLTLIFTPIVMENLGTDAYGLQSLVNVIIGFLMVADLGLDIPVTKFIAEYKAKDDISGINKMLNSTLQIYLIIGLAGMLVIVGISGWLVEDIFKIPEHLRADGRMVFILAGVGFFGSVFALWGKAAFNGFQRYDIGNSINILNNLFSTFIGIALVINGFGVISFVSVKVFFSLASGIAYLLYAKKLLPTFKATLGIDYAIWLLLKGQIGYGFLLRFSGILFSRMDQTLIGAWIGVSAVGIYSVPYLITSYLLAFVGNLVHFVFPMTSALHSTNKKEELNSMFMKVSAFIASLSCLLYVPLMLFGDKFLTLWVGRSIGDSGSVVLVLLGLATWSSCLSNIVINSYVLGIGQIRVYAIWAITRGIVMTIGCLFWIKPLGIEGAGLSLLLTCIIDYIYFYFVVKTFLQIPIMRIMLRAYVKPISISILLLGGGYFVRPFINDWFSLVIACAGIVFTYLSLGFAVAMFGESEKKAVFSLFYMVSRRK